MPRGERVVLDDISAPEDRVIRITNFHWDATDENISEFFDGFAIVDWKRDVNVKAGKNSVAYVLLRSLDEVIRAIEGLHLKEILGRQVRVMRAKGGFERKLTVAVKVKIFSNRVCVVTSSGRLNLTDPEHTATFINTSGAAITRNLELVTAPTPDDMSFPPLPPLPTHTENMSALTPQNVALRRMPPRAPRNFERHPSGMAMVPRNRRPKHANVDGPENRVLLIIKLHPDANRNAIELFFRGLKIVDYKRKWNDRLKKFNTTAFVMFASVQERNRAKATMDGQKILGRAISLEVATRGIKVTENGFVPDEDNGIGPLRSHALHRNENARITYPSEAVFRAANGSFDFDDGNGKDAPVKALTFKEPVGNIIDRTHQWAQDIVHPVVGSEGYLDDGCISPKAQTAYHADVAHHTDDIKDDLSIHFRDPWADSQLPRGTPVVQRCRIGPWNLAGYDREDKRFNIVTEKEWYGFRKVMWG